MSPEEYADKAVAWSGMCDDCCAVFVVYPHPESVAGDIDRLADGPNEWETFTECFVCEGRIEWLGSDPVKDVIR